MLHRREGWQQNDGTDGSDSTAALGSPLKDWQVLSKGFHSMCQCVWEYVCECLEEVLSEHIKHYLSLHENQSTASECHTCTCYRRDCFCRGEDSLSEGRDTAIYTRCDSIHGKTENTRICLHFQRGWARDQENFNDKHKKKESEKNKQTKNKWQNSTKEFFSYTLRELYNIKKKSCFTYVSLSLCGHYRETAWDDDSVLPTQGIISLSHLSSLLLRTLMPSHKWQPSLCCCLSGLCF